MSRGFVKEPEPDAPPDPLPEIPLPPPPNPVTARGLAAIEEMIADLKTHIVRGASADPAETVELKRKLRYWLARRANAHVTDPPRPADEVGFGSIVTLEWPGRGTVRIEIVGEDESAPRSGRIGWRAPAAAALIGNGTGDRVEARIGGRIVPLTIVAVDNAGLR